MTPQVRIRFALTGIFDPEELTRFLKLIPTRTWKAGDVIPGTTRTQPHSYWDISTDFEESIDIHQQIHHILGEVIDHSDRIREACKVFSLEAEVACGIYVEDETPAIHFGIETLDTIRRLGADLDVDIIRTVADLSITVEN